jgi:hypothetical protein
MKIRHGDASVSGADAAGGAEATYRLRRRISTPRVTTAAPASPSNTTTSRLPFPLAASPPVPARGNGPPVVFATPAPGVAGGGAISAGSADVAVAGPGGVAVDVAAAVSEGTGVSVVAGTGVKVAVAGSAVLLGAGVGVFAACTTIVPVIWPGCTLQTYVYVPGTENVTGPYENGDGCAPESHVPAPPGTLVELVV